MKKIFVALLFLLTSCEVFGQGMPGSTSSIPTYIKGKQWKNIKDFGAQGDGTTNDLAAIQAAVDALPDTGGVVFVPFASVGYIINAPIVLPSNVTMLGEGKGSRIVLSGSATRTMITNADSVGGNTGIVISQLYLDGGKSYTSYTEPDSADCILLKNVSKSVISNNWITNTDKDGIALRAGSVDNEVSGNILWSLGEDGITVSGAATRRNRIFNNSVTGRDTTYKDGSNQIPSGILCKASETVISGNIIRYGGAAIDINREDASDTLRQVVVANNIFVECNRTTVSIADGYDIRVEGNTFKDCRQRGIFTWATSPTSHHVQISNNSFWNQTSHAIYAASGDHYVVSGNMVYSPDSTGILVAGNYSGISNNRIDDPGTYGIWLQSSRYSTVSGNVVNSAGESGVYCEGASDSEYVTVTGNVVRNSRKNGIYLLSHDLCVVSANQCIDNDSNNTGYAGIYVYASNFNTVSDNVCTSPLGQQDYGLNFFSSAYNICHSNFAGGNSVSAIANLTTSNLLYGNKLDALTTMRFYTQNRIGIGTESPGAAIEIEDATPAIILDQTGGNASIFFQDSASGQWELKFEDTSQAFILRRSGVGDYIKIATNGDIEYRNLDGTKWRGPRTPGTNGQVLTLAAISGTDTTYWSNAGGAGTSWPLADSLARILDSVRVYFVENDGDTIGGTGVIFDFSNSDIQDLRALTVVQIDSPSTVTGKSPGLGIGVAGTGDLFLGNNLVDGMSGRIRFWQSSFERIRITQDSLSGLNRAWLTDWVAARIDSIISDIIVSNILRADTLDGIDTTGIPTMGDDLDMNGYSILNADSIEVHRLSADTVRGTVYEGLPDSLAGLNEAKAVINDSLDIVRAEIHDSLVNPMHYKYIESQPYSWDRPLADSIIVLHNRLLHKDSDSAKAVLVIDSCRDITPSKNDTLLFVVAFEDSVTIDTIGLEYICSNANNYITAIDYTIGRNGNGGNFADSIVTAGYTATTDRDATSWTYLPLDNTDRLLPKGTRFGVRIIVTHAADNGAVKIAWIRLAYRKR